MATIPLLQKAIMITCNYDCLATVSLFQVVMIKLMCFCSASGTLLICLPNPSFENPLPLDYKNPYYLHV